MRGPLNYYRNHNLTWELTAGVGDTVGQPAMFVAGDRDGVIMMAANALAELPKRVTDLRINELIPGVGHWTQQEAPEAVSDAILRFLAMVAE
jgi:pimeloyl-ACP methyl ester carboxylesterase